jgi:hypothetical protein
MICRHLGCKITHAASDFQHQRVVISKYLLPVRRDDKSLRRKKTGGDYGDQFHESRLAQFKIATI